MASGQAEDQANPLLAPDEPPPCRVHNPQGCSSFLLLADHASGRVPRSLDGLGLSPEDRGRHIALDLGVAPLAAALAGRLDAALIHPCYSRLVIDCNRAPARADAIPEVSDGSLIPGNRGLGDAQRQARVAAIHAPYHAGIAGELARRDAAGREAVVVALHSFTPALAAGRHPPALRPWHAGVLYGGGEEGFARSVLRQMEARLEAPVGDNEPYAMDGIDYTIPHHCFAAARRYVELEIRQDLLVADGGPERWADLVAEVLAAALEHA